MSDDNGQPETHRPNANYKLSNPDSSEDPQGGIVFHYNRGRRLQNAPDSVKSLYLPVNEKQNRFSLLGPLIADRPRRAMFLIIILMCAVIWAFSMAGYFDSGRTLDGNRLEISGAAFEGATIVTIKKTAKNLLSQPYTGAVDIAVTVPSQAEEEPPVFYHRIYFTMNQTEQYRFAAPFDSKELLMVLQSEKNEIRLSIKTD
ncbi:MAG: hypothetical protein FWB83_00640 [Treponema sp.]|nr:hypothetical protein [Treponema sp.]